MSEELALDVGPSGIQIAFERFGDPASPPVLLVMGAGAQMIYWPDGFCTALVRHGLHVIRFDNRDCGRSTHFPNTPTPYTLSDMAADTTGLLDTLGLDSTHIVGGSLGGMVAQTLAIEHPTRVRSLTSVMSTTGAPGVGLADHRATAGLGTPPAERAAYVAWEVRAVRTVGSPRFPLDEEETAALAGRAFDRGLDHPGAARQVAAARASGDRTGRLRSVRVPTLVVHGTNDVLCDISGGRATAAAVPGAELMVVAGMGHNLPPGVWPQITGRIAALVRRAEGGAPRA
ncbi:alpha/beta fold hydrolase [Streptomyces caatingaensis]|uniref:Alpha/beta hydrolase n=1 Tax=Streptomyces caatingaensis TaxID=1678637 RepID=A0A0K9XB42_9ACTN|nr:alpha/beta hydrolase [Streptomyces caatingaensis]KNB50635.1 alpha/beta hydrolase [Streptomyces caatingaensis]